MPLPTVADCKAYLRIETAAEDALLGLLLARAMGLVESHLGRPITAVARTFSIESAGGTLILPLFPTEAAGLVIEDADGTVIDAADFRLLATAGLIRRVDRGRWSNVPYTVTATVGLSLHPDYATVIEPVLSAAILDLVSDLYSNRNPTATNEATAGVSRSLASDGPPARTRESLMPWRIGPTVS